jgi:hypothetical protein
MSDRKGLGEKIGSKTNTYHKKRITLMGEEALARAGM